MSSDDYHIGAQQTVLDLYRPKEAVSLSNDPSGSEQIRRQDSASGAKEIAGMTIGLAVVMLGFVWWL